MAERPRTMTAEREEIYRKAAGVAGYGELLAEIDAERAAHYSTLNERDSAERLLVDSAELYRKTTEQRDSSDQTIRELRADAMIAHRWFAARFGDVMNGRDFSVKCAMASRELFESTEREPALSDQLAEALLKLRNETSGFVGMSRVEDHGHTNYSVINLRLDEADAALAQHAAARSEPRSPEAALLPSSKPLG
jgi:hypothetical protein